MRGTKTTTKIAKTARTVKTMETATTTTTTMATMATTRTTKTTTAMAATTTCHLQLAAAPQPNLFLPLAQQLYSSLACLCTKEPTFPYG